MTQKPEPRHEIDGNAYTNAPERKVRVGYLPDGEDDGLWRINAYRDPFGPPTPLDVRRALAARRPAALPAASVPRWSTTSRPALPGPRR
ncbi:hypothetical protein [Streptomyces anulatus]|uniref:hypothetical protein n=1 Tax=Streptomyces anulatus TaxID=1892 RepID=UPI003F4A1AB3